MAKPLKNMAASVLQRLLDKSRKTGEPYQFLVERYALERMLYRLGCSDHAARFILKGGLLMSVWMDQPYRSTRDADVLAFGESAPENLVSVFGELCSLEVENDGLAFQKDSIAHSPIKEEQEYGGTRLKLKAQLGTYEVDMQFDIGFGDAVTPEAQRHEYPPILPNFPAPRLRIYPKETVIAEKFDTIVQRQLGNSRMKDYYDIFFLQGTFSFDGELLAQALTNTFNRRGTALPDELPLGLTSAFFIDAAKINQWQAFVRKNPLQVSQYSLEDIVNALQKFLMPPAKAAAQKQAWKASWSPQKGWIKIEDFIKTDRRESYRE
jgi:predicted nucleotidyltransferase component of viral defense system